ncbi:hypothetical protein K490DRAFT_54249 [Saccharata proteae CBS 121410]|uniref:Zn(2)-C6 fungal-type domain-containing protein n=1 Tax=Saccharata proteae CBS 121410 TaxID=1314787 RepID=A0A9P4HVB6_9PEZI|nr:hypothetical protein K490DRAFT_54249 [Saccharata proteae CBS 121410]
MVLLVLLVLPLVLLVLLVLLLPTAFILGPDEPRQLDSQEESIQPRLLGASMASTSFVIHSGTSRGAYRGSLEPTSQSPATFSGFSDIPEIPELSELPELPEPQAAPSSGIDFAMTEAPAFQAGDAGCCSSNEYWSSRGSHCYYGINASGVSIPTSIHSPRAKTSIASTLDADSSSTPAANTNGTPNGDGTPKPKPRKSRAKKCTITPDDEPRSTSNPDGTAHADGTLNCDDTTNAEGSTNADDTLKTNNTPKPKPRKPRRPRAKAFTTNPDGTLTPNPASWPRSPSGHAYKRIRCRVCFNKRYACDRNLPCSSCVKKGTECIYDHAPPLTRTGEDGVKVDVGVGEYNVEAVEGHGVDGAGLDGKGKEGEGEDGKDVENGEVEEGNVEIGKGENEEGEDEDGEGEDD